MADQFVAHLATVPLFAQCSKHDLAEIARFVDEIDVEAGRELITEGDVGHEAFVVVDGHRVGDPRRRPRSRPSGPARSSARWP